MEKGYIQIYTGNGKGKTTSALGLALRAICAGYKVFMGQFLKGMEVSELKAEELLKNFKIKQYGLPRFITGSPTKEDIEAAKKGLEDVKKEMLSGKYDIIILDELNVALHLGLLEKEEVMELIKSKPDNVELIITGRYAPDWLIKIADLVTEMKEIKHYYQKGVPARKGIEM